MVRVVDPIGIFLIETKVSTTIVDHVMRRVGFLYYEAVPPEGCKGGLVFCWRPELRYNVVWKSRNVLHLLIKPGSDYQDFLCSLVYESTLWHHKEVF